MVESLCACFLGILTAKPPPGSVDSIPVMHPILRRRFETSIIEDLRNLDGPQLERVCTPLVRLIEGVPLLPRGQTLDGKPLSGDVDSFDGTRSICLECGTEKEYYERKILKGGVKDSFGKPLHDLHHAKRKCPNATRVYLFSNQRLPVTEHQELLSAVQAEARTIYGQPCDVSIGLDSNKGPGSSITVLLFSQREIAEELVSRLISRPDAAEHFPDIPSVRAIYHDLVFEKAIPQLPDSLVGRDDVLADVRLALRDHRRAVIVGISGIGKS